MDDAPQPLNVELDWRAYFQDFCAFHGGDPVPWRGKLLFRDGWSYAANDHKGPEWPPPSDPAELRAAQRFWWEYRLRLIRHELRELRLTHRNVKEQQAGRTVPLRQVARIVTRDEGGQRRIEEVRGPVDLSVTEARMVILNSAQLEAEGVLESLREPKPEGAEV